MKYAPAKQLAEQFGRLSSVPWEGSVLVCLCCALLSHVTPKEDLSPAVQPVQIIYFIW